MRHPHTHPHSHPGRDERRFRFELPDEDGFPGFGPRDLRGGPRGHRGGPHPGGGPHRGGRRGQRARGDVRAAILLLLDEQPRHGYELIQEIAERSQGAWTPSPGSVYPTLQALADEGLVAIDPVEGRRTASLTPEGVAHVAEHRARMGSPWTPGEQGRGPALAFRQEILALKDAAAQVARVGTPEQQAAATALLVTARKGLYRLLAQDDSDDEA